AGLQAALQVGVGQLEDQLARAAPGRQVLLDGGALAAPPGLLEALDDLLQPPPLALEEGPIPLLPRRHRQSLPPAARPPPEAPPGGAPGGAGRPSPPPGPAPTASSHCLTRSSTR